MKERPRFHIALESFYELFSHSRNNLERDAIMKDLAKHFQTTANIEALTEGLNVSADVTKGLESDELYGLSQYLS